MSAWISLEWLRCMLGLVEQKLWQGHQYGKFMGHKPQISPAMPWTSYGCPNAVLLPMALALNISDLTWLINSEGSSTTAVWTFAQHCWLKRDSYLCTEEQGEVKLLIVPGIAHARSCPEESSLNYSVVTAATHGPAGEYSEPFCAVVNKVTVSVRELQ